MVTWKGATVVLSNSCSVSGTQVWAWSFHTWFVMQAFSHAPPHTSHWMYLCSERREREGVERWGGGGVVVVGCGWGG